jgi:hypothetical protein
MYSKLNRSIRIAGLRDLHPPAIQFESHGGSRRAPCTDRMTAPTRTAGAHGDANGQRELAAESFIC